jgi:ABC-type dipeptide/oligopeptide/nickel transport system permease component
LTYVARRLLAVVPVVFGISVIVFLILHLAPGDPAHLIAGSEALPEDIARVREQLGLDQPLHVQYLRYVSRVLQGDLGTSVRAPRAVLTEIQQRMPRTLELAVLAIVIAILIGIPAGVLSAVKQYSWLDNVAMFSALVGVSMPGFWLGLLLIMLFANYLAILPVSGYGGPLWTLQGLSHALLPATALGLAAAAYVTRLTRSSMLEVIRQDYIRTARAKGLRGSVVIFRHALKNSLIPVITMLGVQFGYLMAGSIVIETVFSWPGMGRLIVTSIYSRDYPLAQGAVLVMGLVFVVLNLLVDLLYGYLDPRISHG